MTFMEWLFEKTPDETVPPPPYPPRVTPRPPHLIEAEDEATWQDRLRNAPGHDLEEIYTIIDYRDADDILTRRRITLRRVQRGPHAPILRAVCHERRAVRHFRCDRIEGFIEDDGVVTGCAEFFREVMDIDLATLAPTEGQLALNSARRIRDALRPPLSVLVIVARADGMVAAECDAILDYARAEVAALRDRFPDLPTMDEGVAEKLLGLVTKMNPQRSSLRGYLDAVASYDHDRRARFEAALSDVVNADGRFSPEERAIFEGLDLLEVTEHE